jgi:tetratricopeptide (TPR) repeat protein
MSNQAYQRITLAAGLFLAAHLLFAHWHPFSLWGLDYLRFYPLWAQALFAVLAALPFFSFAQPWLIRLFSHPRLFTLPLGSAFVVAGVALFIALQSAVHLLGDGELCLREISKGAGRRGNAPLTFWLLEQIHQLLRFTQTPALNTYQIYTYLSGALYLSLSLVAARRWGQTPAAQALLLGGLCSLGLIQLFFGYVENYALLIPGMLFYFFYSFRFLNGSASPYPVAGVLSILVLLHFEMLMLVPSLLVLFYLRSSLSHKSLTSPTNTPSSTGHLALALGLPLLLGFVALWALGLEPLTYLKKTQASHLLPILEAPGFKQAYRLFSFSHFLDYTNLVFLVSPATLWILTGSGFKRCTLSKPEHLFLWVAALPPLAFAFFFNPEIGFCRDWDLLCFALLPLSIWTVLLVSRSFEDQARLARLTLILCWSAGLHTLFWIGLNAQESPSVARFTRLLEQAPLSAYARSYGWDTLGEYYRRLGQPRRALAAYSAATKANPTNARHWAGQGYQHLELDQKRPAIEAFHQALHFDSTKVLLWNRLGLLYSDLDEYDQSIKALQRAINLGLNTPTTWFTLGEAFRLQGANKDAIAAFQKALDLNPNMADIHLSLGIAYHADGATDLALTALQRAVALDSTLQDAHNQLGHLYLYDKDLDKALNAFKKVESLDPNYVEVHYNLAFVYYQLKRPELTRHHGETFLRLWRGDPSFSKRIDQLLAQ